MPKATKMCHRQGNCSFSRSTLPKVQIGELVSDDIQIDANVSRSAPTMNLLALFEDRNTTATRAPITTGITYKGSLT